MFVLALHAPLSVTAGTADGPTSVPVTAEHHDEGHSPEPGEDHDGHGHGREEASEVHLSPEQRRTLNLGKQ